MAEKCSNGVYLVECLINSFIALQKKMEADFSQAQSLHKKVKALTTNWVERSHQLKVEEEKLAELEVQITLLNTKQEEVLASLKADMLCAASQIQEKEELAKRLRSEVAFLETRVACKEDSGNAAELEKGAHEAWLALEDTLSSLCLQLEREEVESKTFKSQQETLPPLQHREQFLCGQDSECPVKAEGAEAAAEEAPQGQPQGAVGGLQEEAKPRASRGAWVFLRQPIIFWLSKGMPWVPGATGQGSNKLCPAARSSFQKCREVSLRVLSGKGFCSWRGVKNVTSALLPWSFSEVHPAEANCHLSVE